MTDDIKGVETKVEETTNQQAPVDETNEGVETDDPTAPEGEANESEIDYKAELERIKALVEVKDNRLNKAEHKIVELKKEMGQSEEDIIESDDDPYGCLLYTSPSPRDRTRSRMPSSA